jgi:hypothetical protein
MIVISPSAEIGSWISEILATFGDLGTYVQAAALTLRPSWLPYIDKGMLATQVVTVGVQILLQFTLVLAITKDLWHKWKTRNAMKQLRHAIYMIRKKVIVKKYANVWLYRVHKRTLQGWPIPSQYTEETSVAISLKSFRSQSLHHIMIAKDSNSGQREANQANA